MDEENLRPTDKTIYSLVLKYRTWETEVFNTTNTKIKRQRKSLDLTLLRAFHSSFVPEVILFRKGQFDVEESVIMW